MKIERIRLWDLPTRLFHWLLVILVTAAVVTGQLGGAAMAWHGRIGLAILGLLTFRLVWGLIGSSHARFASFLPTPSSIFAHLRGQWRGIGHNPLGALSILGLLALIALQVGSGLLANDDIGFHGPLFDLVGGEISDQSSAIHEVTSTALIALIMVHLAAIAFYTQVRKETLIKPMITGWKDLESTPGEASQSATGGGALALSAALLIALAVVYAGSGAWLPAPVTAVREATAG